MAFNPFLGPFWTQEKLESALALAQQDLAAGKSTTSAGDGSVFVKSSIDSRPAVRIELLYRALNKLCSAQYPIDEITRITNTRAVFGTPPVDP